MKKLLLLFIAVFAISVVASCEPVQPTKVCTQELVDECADMLYGFNKPGENNALTSSKVFVTTTEYEDFDMDVDWKIVGEVEEEYAKLVNNGDGTVTLAINKYANADKSFKLVGTVTCGEFTKSFEFGYVIKEFLISDWNYWKENDSKVAMNIQGIIVAKDVFSQSDKSNYTSLYLQDLNSDHGYYAYKVVCKDQKAYDTDLAVGNVVTISGTTSLYNGFREMGANCTYDLVMDDAGKVVTRSIKEVDITDILDDNAKLDDLQGMMTVIKGAKIVAMDVATPFDKATNKGSMNVKVEKDGKQFVTRMSTSNTMTYDALVAEVAKLQIGYVVDVKGPLVWYNAPQLYPIIDGYVVLSTEVTDQDKADTEIKTINLPKTVDKEQVITLPTVGATYDDVSILYEVLEGGSHAVYADGKLTITLPETNLNVKIKAVAHCGQATKEKEFVFEIQVAELTDEEKLVMEAYALASGTSMEGTKTLTGEITQIKTAYSAEYGNITVLIQVGSLTNNLITCYRMKGAGADTLAVGDVITVSGTIKNYNGTIEFDSGCTFVVAEAPVLTDEEKIVIAAYELAENTAMEGTKTLTGVITEVKTAYSAQYSNITVVIQVGTLSDKLIECFRMKGEGADALKAGDTITVTGTIKNYNGTVEFDNGCTFVLASSEPVLTDEEMIVIAAYELAENTVMEGTQTLTGVITEVKTAYSAQYSNITVVIQVGNLSDKLIDCFRMKGEGADALKVGDTITVTGIIKNYNGTVEFDNGCTFVMDGGTEPSEDIEPKDEQEALVLDVYKLGAGETTATAVELTGVIKNITSAYSAQFNNISVDIQVGTLSTKLINCFRIKGEGAEDLEVGHTITVTGFITNYNGTKIQFVADSTFVVVGGLSFTDEELVNKDLAKVTAPASTSDDFDLVLVGAHDTVISWESDNAAIVIEGNKAVVTATPEVVVVTLTATVTKGEATATKAFKVSVKAAEVTNAAATFTFGPNKEASHFDGKEDANYTETCGEYTLTLTDTNKVYSGANDAKGNSALKLGTSSVGGKFSFTVSADVTKVIIYVAAYKAKTATVTINGVATTLQNKSDNGTYDAIEVVLGESKTVTLEVTSGLRALVNTIEFYK